MRRHFPATFLTVAVALLATPVLASATVQFSNPTTIATVTRIADLDGGLPDLAFTSGAGVFWRPNLGAMQFGAQQGVTLAPSGSVTSFVVTDLNGDGRNDLAGLTTTGLLAVCLGSGGGAFGPILSSSLPVTGNGIVAADFDGDGRTDLAVSHIDAAQVSVWIGQGDGTFAPPVVYSTGTPPTRVYGTVGYRDIVAGRFGGDAKPDLVVLDHYPRTTIVVLVNQGDGTFAPATHTPGFGSFETNLVSGDFDADGLDDLVIGVESPAIGILRALGGGAFAPADSVKSLGSNYAPSPAVGDLDGDGRLDLAFAYSIALSNYDGNYLGVRTGTGDCHFAPEVDYQIGEGAGGTMLDDLDGDGLLDAIANGSGTLHGSSTITSPSSSGWIFRNVGGGQLTGYETQFPGTVCGPSPTCKFESWSLGVVRKNAPADLLLVSGNGHTLWRRNRGNGTFDAPLDVLGLPCVKGPDLDGDGRDELLSSSGPDSTAIVMTTGDATWAPPVWYVGGTKLGFADFDGDGRLDLALKDSSRRLVIRSDDGAGGFGPAAPTDLVFPSVVTFGLTFGDTDGDGRADVIYSPERNVLHDSLFVITLPPGGGVDTTATILLPSQPSYPLGRYGRPQLGRAGPGAPPVLYVLAGSNACDCSGYVLSYHRESDGSWTEVSRLTTGRDPDGISVADFDLDGIDELIFTQGNDSGNQFTFVYVYPGNVSGVLSGPMSFFPGMYPGAAFAERIDGDDRPDLCNGLTYYGRLGFRLNTSTPNLPTPTLCSLVSVSAEPGIVHLEGFADGAGGVTARLERRTASTWWGSVAAITPDGTGHYRYDDRGVTSGRWAYRLVAVETGAVPSAEVWVDVPDAIDFAVGGVEPNPISRSARVTFRLAATSPVRVTVLDLQGRRRGQRAEAAIGAGSHTWTVPGAAGLESGVYLLRMEAAGRAVTRRFSVVR